jgi:L-lactate dehydrogenase (cytochrome)
MEGVVSLSQWTSGQFDPTLNWKDIEWIRGIWPGKMILKGILDVEDAKTATKSGASAIIVSNHGGRQLDTAPAAIEVLGEIAAVVGNETEVFMDGGIRRGTDIVKALALGARAVLLGRPVLWGLALNGEEGVTHVLEILHRELDQAMALCGCSSIEEIDHTLVRPAPR